MSTAALNDLNARRQPTGKFGSKQFNESEVILGRPPQPEPRYSQFDNVLSAQGIDRRAVINHWPDTRSEAKRRLVNLRGESGGLYRQVTLDSANTDPRGNTVDTTDVAGPKDGRPIIVRVTSGMPVLRVTSGKAIIHADSLWNKNRILVCDGAEAVILGDQSREITITAQQGSKVTLLCESAENKFDVLRAPGSTVTERFGPEAVSAPVCEECGEVMMYATCQDCYCACGKPSVDGPDPNLCQACNEDEAAAEAADHAAMWNNLDAARKRNEEMLAQRGR